MSAERKMITPTPTATPVMMSQVCARPSRRYRRATSSSNGMLPRSALGGFPGAHAFPGGDRRRQNALALAEAGEDLDGAVALEPDPHAPPFGAAVTLDDDPRRRAARVPHAVERQ